MSILNYSVLKGTPQSGQLAFEKNWKGAHFRLFLNAGDVVSQVDINIESLQGTEVLFALNNAFAPSNARGLNELLAGFTPLDSVPGTLALDYVREKIGDHFMVSKADMSLLPFPKAGSANQNPVVEWLDNVSASQTSTVYAFGSSFSDPNGTTGIHNIHMNQGNPGGHFETENGIWSDGALFVFTPSTQTWSALFIAFQTQSWQTDENGNPLNVRASRHSHS